MTGIELIAAERLRQVEVEGWTAEHDAEHEGGDLAIAASCYTTPEESRDYPGGPTFLGPVPAKWPWDIHWWKPTPDDRVRELVKAGALIAAEIDRFQAAKEETDAP